MFIAVQLIDFTGYILERKVVSYLGENCCFGKNIFNRFFLFINVS